MFTILKISLGWGVLFYTPLSLPYPPPLPPPGVSVSIFFRLNEKVYYELTRRKKKWKETKSELKCDSELDGVEEERYKSNFILFYFILRVGLFQDFGS